MSPISRRSFVAASSLATVTPAIPAVAAARTVIDRMDGGLPPMYASADPEVVRSVVGKSHVDLDTVKELVTEKPELAKASWDWGFGDWESALGAASHMGRRDIAEFLIKHGARPNLFTFTMLGQVDVVRATCENNPGIQRTLGPHGITLLQHARHGGDDAKSVVAYLEALGDADNGQRNDPLEDEQARSYTGSYVPAAAPDVAFHVKFNERRRGVTFQRDAQQFRFLLYQGNDTFSPGGAPSVKIIFNLRHEDGATVTIRDGGLELVAVRGV